MSKTSRRLLLAAASVLSIIIFLSIPFYGNWFNKRIMLPLNEISEQSLYMEPEARMEQRFGSSYTISRKVGEYLDARNAANDYVLLPPKDFVKEVGADYSVPEPVIFYYYTGKKAKWANSPGAEKSRYVVYYQQGKLQLLYVTEENIQRYIDFFRRYKISL